jgi:hypothetical protein
MEGVRQLLAVDSAVEIVAAVGDVESLREACDRRPLAEELRDTHRAIHVVVPSQFSDPVDALALLERGSDRSAYAQGKSNAVIVESLFLSDANGIEAAKAGS